jgi:hypothetical protein
MKICKECDRPVFGGGYCRYHQYFRRKLGGDLYKPKPRQKSIIPKESKRRKIEHIRYTEQVKLFKEECKEQGIYKCFISGEDFDDTIDGFVTVHHLHGRTGDYYTDKQYWILARNKYHLDVFHKSTIEELQKFPFWEDFLVRLKIKDLHSYHKLLKRIEKSEDLFGND